MSTQRAALSGIPVYCTFERLEPLVAFKLNPANPNRHAPRQIALYAEVIRANGWRRAVTVSTRSGMVVRGEGAFLAAKHLGLEAAPIELQHYDSEDAELADLLADNRVADFAETDDAKLRELLARLVPLAGVVTGYNSEDLASLLEQIAPAAELPIVARLNERHDYVVITVDNETDWQFLKNLVGVREERSYKNATIGEGRVIPFARFLESLQENRDALYTAELRGECPGDRRYDEHGQPICPHCAVTTNLAYAAHPKLSCWKCGGRFPDLPAPAAPAP